jgi:hypothetical protein
MVAAPLAVTVGETAPQADCGHGTIQATPIFAESLVTTRLKWHYWLFINARRN